ncbi:MAG: cell division protein FtsQ/DivIB [Gemmatimonadales bacterium]
MTPGGSRRDEPDEPGETAGRGSPVDDRAPSSARLKLALVGIAVLVALLSPLWGPLLMRRMAFFRVRRVEIVGARYLSPSDIISRLHVDTTASVWDPTAPLVARVAAHPEIQSVAIRRKLPGTLVVSVTERVPVALVPTSAGLRTYDARGVQLPIDPTRVIVDAPVLAQRDLPLLHLLGEMRSEMPELYRQVNAVRRTGPTDVLLELASGPVRVMQDVSLDRLADIDPVEADIKKRQLRVTELDLRYRDQVIARLQ